MKFIYLQTVVQNPLFGVVTTSGEELRSLINEVRAEKNTLEEKIWRTVLPTYGESRNRSSKRLRIFELQFFFKLNRIFLMPEFDYF